MCNRVMKVVRGWIILKCFPQRTHFSASLYQINILIPRTSFAKSQNIINWPELTPKLKIGLIYLSGNTFQKNSHFLQKKYAN